MRRDELMPTVSPVGYAAGAEARRAIVARFAAPTTACPGRNFSRQRRDLPLSRRRAPRRGAGKRPSGPLSLQTAALAIICDPEAGGAFILPARAAIPSLGCFRRKSTWVSRFATLT